jgi:hypothetical protein
MVDDQNEWVSQGEEAYAAEGVELLDLPLDEVVMEHVVIGLGTVNGVLLTAGVVGLIVFCCWKNKRGSVGDLASDDELGDDAHAEPISDAELGRGGPSRFRDQHGVNSSG